MNKYFTPNAAVIVYNYIDRQGDYDLTVNTRDEIEEIILKSEIIQIQTQKSKSQPSGSFSIALAPTKNWTSVLTPGSWLSIHMSPKKLKTKSSDSGGILEFSSKTLKMIGRIDSVAMNVNVDQESGARMTIFTITGRDWGQVFESSIYIDPMASLTGENGLGQAVKMKFDKLLIEKSKNPLSTTNLTRFFIDIWGVQQDNEFKKNIASDLHQNNINVERVMPESAYFLPKKLHERFFLNGSAKGENRLANNIEIISGKLIGYNNYKDFGETFGVPNMGSIIGGNTLWQVLNAHCGSVVNEMFSDFTWKDNRLVFSLYKRVKPFLLTEDDNSTNGSNISSSFFNIPRNDIDFENVMQINVGTNWRDKINFVEVLPQVGHLIPSYAFLTPMSKAKNCSAADYISFGRDGFKPMLYSTFFLPSENGIPGTQININEWLPVIKKWYFNNHKMLNGTIVISNQEEYIGVGENIGLDGRLFTASYHVKDDDSKGENGIAFLAHVESVTNTFSVDNNGTRNFTTSVSFVRGVFTYDSYLALYNPESYGIDSNANDIQEENEKIGNVHEVKNE